MDDRYTVDTPENVEFAYDIAGIGSRFLAAIIDTFILALTIIALLVALGLLLPRLGLDTDGALANNTIVVLLFGGLFLLLISYYILFEMIWNGQTPGKRAIGLRTVRNGGRPITFVSSAVRNLIRLADFLPSFYGLGVVVMFIDRQARRLGDLAAGTLVVKERRAVTLESLTAPSASLPQFPADQPLPQLTLPNMHLLNNQDYELVQEFLRRRGELGREARLRLGAQLADGIKGRLGLPREGEPEGFLQLVALEYQLMRRQQQIESGG
ncbi:MAG TPA: RDD family protein [Roseiflexaceae bacterium]|nr:RDD family protein [Roseiflexaceae bacterium]